MLLQALIFDIDGTLIDSNDMHLQCWLEAFEHFGKRVDPEEMRSQIGKGGDLIVPDTLNAREMRRFGEELQKFRAEHWKKNFMQSVEPFAGAADAVRALHDMGIEIALASSSHEDEVNHYVDLLGLGEVIAGATSKQDARFSKPSPEIFGAALERISSRPERTAAVGDTPWDILAAHRVPLPAIAVLAGGFPAHALAKAEFLFDDVPAMMREIESIDDCFRD